MRDDGSSLEWIDESLQRIAAWTRDGRNHFLDDDVLQEAVLGRMEHLAHEAGGLSDEPKMRHREIEWDRMRDFRNFVAHGYRSVDLEQLRTYIENDLPDLRRVVAAELLRHRNRDRDSEAESQAIHKREPDSRAERKRKDDGRERPARERE